MFFSVREYLYILCTGYYLRGNFLQRFVNVRNSKKYYCKNFNGYTAIIVVMNSRTNFQSQKVSIEVSWHFRKYFSAQNNSSLQYFKTEA